MARIIIADNPLNELDIARQLLPPDLDAVIARHGSPEFNAALRDAVCLVGFGDGTMDDAFYKTAPNLKLVQLLSAGYDRCDIEAARRAGVPICNNGGANSTAVAEHAMLLMLAVCRRLVWQHSNVAAGRWRGNAVQDVKLYELKGRTLGIVGLGSIGKGVARRVAGFDCRILYTNRNRISAAEEQALGVTYAPLDQLLAESDIVSLNCPLTEATKGMINAAALAKMKPGALLVNVARGGVVVEADLVEALKSGHLGGAAVDVFDQEPPPKDHPLLHMDSVICSPHCASTAFESSRKGIAHWLDNIARVSRGEAIPEVDKVV